MSDGDGLTASDPFVMFVGNTAPAARGDGTSKAAFTRMVIIGTTHTISALSAQAKGSKTYRFLSWSDGAHRHTT